MPAAPPAWGSRGAGRGQHRGGGTNVRDSTPPALLQPRSPPGGGGTGLGGGQGAAGAGPGTGPPRCAKARPPPDGRPGNGRGGARPPDPLRPPRPSPKLQDAPRPGGAQRTQVPAGGLRAPRHALGCRCPALAWHSGARARCSVHGWTRVHAHARCPRALLAAPCTPPCTLTPPCPHCLAPRLRAVRGALPRPPSAPMSGGSVSATLRAQDHPPHTRVLSPGPPSARGPQLGARSPTLLPGRGPCRPRWSPATGLLANVKVARPQQQAEPALASAF